MGRRVRGVLFALLFGAYLTYWIIRPIKPQTVVACDFVNLPSSAALPIPSSRDTFEKFHIEGSTKDTTQGGMHDYDGLATWMMDGDKAQGAASGVVWQAADGVVEGLFLTVAHPNFGQNELRIATLNQDGILDTNRSNAFLFFDPNDKRSHPVSFTCQTDRNYRHIYQRLFSYDALAAVALALVFWAIMFFGGRKAENMDFGRR